MDTKQLRQKILDLAIRGKLVPQDPNDEPASVLLERVKAEKERLIAEGKIKRSKKSAASSDKPHYADWDLPRGWEWCKVDDLAFVTKLAGFEYTSHIVDNLCEKGVPLFKGKNVQGGRIVYEFESFIPEHVSDDLPRSQITKKCLLTPYVGTIGNIGIHDKKGKFHLGSNVGKIELFNETQTNIKEEFLRFYFMSRFGYKELTKHKKATAQESISIDAIRDCNVPLPPIKEQMRIVECLDYWFSFVRTIDESSLEISNLCGIIKHQILALAISGQLVPQDPADEPAADLLKRVNPNAVVSTDTSHYSIPSTWIWVKLSDIFEINPKNHNNDEEDCGFVPMSNVQDGYSGEHTFEVRKWGKVKKGYSHFQNGDIGVAKISPCFENLKSTIFHSLPNNIGAGTTELVIMRGKEIFAPFFLYLFKSPWYISKGTVYFKGVVGQQRVSHDIFTSLEVPLPPFNEQKRIAAKVDELFAVIDQIQQSLE